MGFNTRPSPVAVTFTHIDGAHVDLHSFYTLRDFNELWQLYSAKQLQEYQTVTARHLVYQTVTTRHLVYQIISCEFWFSLRWV